MIDVFVLTNTPIRDIPKALSGLAEGSRVQVRNGGPTEMWLHTPNGWIEEKPGITLYEDLSAEHVELLGYVTKYGHTKPIDAPSLRLDSEEAKEWLASIEHCRYLVEDGIGCSVDANVDGRIVNCAVATFALSDFKQRVIKPGTKLNDKILVWADEMLKAGADAIDVLIAKRNIKHEWPTGETMGVVCPNCASTVPTQISIVRDDDLPLRPEDCDACRAIFIVYPDGRTELVSAPHRR